MKIKIKKDTYVVYGELNGIGFEIEDVSIEKICRKLYREFVYKKGYSKEIIKLRRVRVHKIGFIRENFRYFSSSEEKKEIMKIVNRINNSRVVNHNGLKLIHYLRHELYYSKNPYLKLLGRTIDFAYIEKKFINNNRFLCKKIKYNKKTFDEIVKIYKKEINNV